MRWIYKTTTQNFDANERSLNDHMNLWGLDSWELVSIVPPQYGGSFLFFWKKPDEVPNGSGVQEHIANPKLQIIPEPTSNKLREDAVPNSEQKAEPNHITFEVGDTIPVFELQSTSGDRYSTSELSKNTILYFYPADGTEGCTIQAKGFSIVYETLADLGLDIVGVSPDNISAHDKFRSDENIPFHLLYDEGTELCEKLGLLKRPPPDEMYPLRVTFLIDKNRKILGKWDDIDVQTHSDDVVSFVVDILEKAN